MADEALGAVRRTARPGRDDQAEIIISGAQLRRGATNTPSAVSADQDAVSSAVSSQDRDALDRALWSGRTLRGLRDAASPQTHRDLIDTILAAGWRPPLPAEHSVAATLAELRAWVEDHRGLGEAVGLALGDTYAGEKFSDPTFERGSTAIVAAVQEWLDEHTSLPDSETRYTEGEPVEIYTAGRWQPADICRDYGGDRIEARDWGQMIHTCRREDVRRPGLQP